MLALILAVVLFPPAVLAFISNNAVPGDRTYPIKRGLETGILAVASVNPTTKAWFTSKRSERRFNEVIVLINNGQRGQNLATPLKDLVRHTSDAAIDVKKIENSIERAKKIAELKQSINKYQQELAVEKKKVESVVSQTPSPTPVVTPIPAVTPTPAGTAGPSPTPGVQPTSTPRATPTPTSRVTASPTPTPTPTPAPIHHNPDDCDNPTLDNINDCLGIIGGGLNTGNSRSSGDNSAAADVRPTPTPTPRPVHGLGSPEPVPTPTPVPIVTPTPMPTPQPISCTACDADVVNTGGGTVDSYDMSALNSCASHASYAQTPVFAAACSKMDKNGNGIIDPEEIDCARSKLGQTCQP